LIKRIQHSILFILFLGTATIAQAQNPGNIIRGIGNRFPAGGGGNTGGGGGNDSVHIRSKFEDSITVNIYFIDSSGAHKLDSSIDDFTKRFPIPSTHTYLGNTGSPTKSLLFDPRLHDGWDEGFHMLDAYKWTLERAHFFNTTRPYTELDYEIASRAEQIIEILHTQNIKPNWNFSFNYRLIAAPGSFRNQVTNHNNYLFTSWYQSNSRRYNNYFVILGNRLQEGENGGLKNQDDLDNPAYKTDRYLIPTRIGGDPVYSPNFFSKALATGRRLREFNVVLRQQYDLGKKDSIVTDSTVIPLFYPRLRFEHTFNYGQYNYSFFDLAAVSNSVNNRPDSIYYKDFYKQEVPQNDSMLYRDKWFEITNDFSIYQFPDAKNLRQFFKLGAEIQLLNGKFIKNSVPQHSTSLYNLMAHGEYRNRTKNHLWDMLAFGQLYLNGYNAGDYRAFVNLQRIISPRIGSLQIGFENVNQSPPFIYDQRSAYYLDTAKTFNKQNTTHAFGTFSIPRLKLQLGADYYLIGNYLYLTDFYRLQQEGTLFNVLRINALKTISLGKHWNWHAELYVQQKTGAAQLHIPTVFTRNRIMYEGNLGFRNLNIVFGLEGRYHTPYKADNYSPLLGQFFFQDSTTISNLPDIAGFLHFRIRSFKAYIRVENLNTMQILGGKNNLAAPGYPTPGVTLRFGIYWSFVN
jgi:hypothetical protein